MFISALKESGSYAAITGSSVADIPALKSASVSYCLGLNGCDIARQVSDLVIEDNDFVTITNSIRWGRNMLLNVRRFVQYNLTVNITCLVIVTLSAVVFGRSPFSVW